MINLKRQLEILKMGYNMVIRRQHQTKLRLLRKALIRWLVSDARLVLCLTRLPWLNWKFSLALIV